MILKKCNVNSNTNLRTKYKNSKKQKQQSPSRKRFHSQGICATPKGIDSALQSFVITPNPAKSNIVITHDGNFQSITITEISGKIVLESNLSKAINNQVFNISDLANGVYIVNLIAENKTERIKLVINK